MNSRLIEIACLTSFILSFMTGINPEFTYEEGEWETMILDLITRALISIPVEEFVDDPQLRQEVDTDRKISTYLTITSGANVNEDSESGKVYTRRSLDSLESIVVLRSKEDNLKVFDKKRTFVALRQNPLTNTTYFVSYVYLRFLTDKLEDCTETYLNEKICLEYDTWDNDRGIVKTRHKYFGWTDCASSFFQTCQTKEENRKKGPEAPPVNQSRDNDPNRANNKLSYKPSEAVRSDDTIQAFWDLEVTPEEGRYIVETIRQTSVFSDPKAFLAKSSAGSMGRSLVSVDKKLQREKDVLKMQANEKIRNASRTFQQINGRKAWLLRKNELSSKLRKLSVAAGIGKYFEIKSDPQKMKELRKIKEADEILDELEVLEEEEFEVNEIMDNEDVEDMKANEILPQADEETVAEPTSLARTFGRSLFSALKPETNNNTNNEKYEDSKVVETIAKSILLSFTDTFEKPGWKFGGTGGDMMQMVLKPDLEVFYGLGNCPFVNTQQTFQKLIKTVNPSPSDLVDFYLAVLRTYCSKGAKNYLMYLIEEKYLKLEKTRFIVPLRQKLTNKLKLRQHEIRKLTAALEISSFSQNYEGESKHNYNWTQEIVASPDAPSRSVHYLMEFGFIYLKQARKLMDNHFVKMGRNLVITLKGVMTKLLQDREILASACGTPYNAACVYMDRINRNDRLAIHSFIQFLIRGLAPVEKDKNVYIDGLFDTFTKTNSEALKRSLEFYS